MTQRTTYVIASSNMEKLKTALGYRPNFHNGNNTDVQVDLSDYEYNLAMVTLEFDKYFKIFRYNINMFCC